jgi:hypothetical protein
MSCSGKGACSAVGVCSCNPGYYGSGCEYKFCGEDTINADAGTVLDRTADGPFPLMTAKGCSWTINVAKDKLASVAIEHLLDTSQRFMTLVIDGAFNVTQVMDMKLEDLAPLVLATSFIGNLLHSFNPGVMPINCSSSLWSGGESHFTFLVLHPCHLTLCSNTSCTRLRSFRRFVQLHFCVSFPFNFHVWGVICSFWHIQLSIFIQCDGAWMSSLLEWREVWWPVFCVQVRERMERKRLQPQNVCQRPGLPGGDDSTGVSSVHFCPALVERFGSSDVRENQFCFSITSLLHCCDGTLYFVEIVQYTFKTY